MRGRGASVLLLGALASAVVLAGAWSLRRERPRVAPLPTAQAQASGEQPPPELEPLADPAVTGAPEAVRTATERTVGERSTAERPPSKPRPRVTLEIALLGAEGQPVREAAIGWLDFDPGARRFAGGQSGAIGELPARAARSPQRLLFHEGVATVADVETGREIVLDVVTDTGVGAARSRIDWFAVEGGEGRGYAQVVVAGSFALHEWRALGQDGAPLAERRFEHCRDT
ncbi:MAG: hypothetical protein JNL90_17255, partial [Planctomycetes bacterium]|nr:hypothetical protein [Planctomycetota bacterium]